MVLLYSDLQILNGFDEEALVAHKLFFPAAPSWRARATHAALQDWTLG